MTKTGQTISLPEADVATIKKAMIDAGVSNADLEAEFGVSRSSITFAIRHPSLVPRVRARLLRRLKLTNLYV